MTALACRVERMIEEMNAEFFDAIADLEREKGIPSKYMLDRIGQALVAAYRRETGNNEATNVFVEPDPVRKTIKMYIRKQITDEVDDPSCEITPDEARAIDPRSEAAGFVDIAVDTKRFTRIAAQTAKQVIIQGIREAERGMALAEYSQKERELVSGVVTRIDPRGGNVFLDVSGDGSEAVLLASEQIQGEHLAEGDRIRVYVIEARASARGVQMVVSRTHPSLVKRLFELEVPEIVDGTVIIKSISREAGSRTKIAVWSEDENVDPIGACVGTRGARVAKIVEELRGEKIDIIKYSDNPAEYIAASLSPSSVISVDLLDDAKSCRVIVPDDQLSLAIGREGQNARLAARLTGYKIDIKPLSQVSL